jgi:hypothetical protein
VIAARDLLHDHRRTYRRFWQWSDAAADEFAMHGKLWTVFGWPLHAEGGDGARTARNFPMQGNGAEMMRLAASYMTEAGVEVCCPVHDAFLIEADAHELDDAVEAARQCMARASTDVLAGFTLRSDAATYVHPSRYSDPRGERMWATVMGLLGEVAPAHLQGASTHLQGAPARQVFL